MIPRDSFDTLVKVALLLDPQTWNDLHHMQQDDLAMAFTRQLRGDFDGLFVGI